MHFSPVTVVACSNVQNGYGPNSTQTFTFPDSTPFSLGGLSFTVNPASFVTKANSICYHGSCGYTLEAGYDITITVNNSVSSLYKCGSDRHLCLVKGN